MQFQARPDDFIVQELIHLPLDSSGDFAVYRIEKRGVTTQKVQHHIAAQLGRRSADVQAPALKDKKSVAIQYLWVRGTGPAELEGPGYCARFVGRSRRPLRPSDLRGNRFTVTLRDLSPEEAAAVAAQLAQVARHGLPNYFDAQRFGSHSDHPASPDPFVGKTILRRDAEGAVRAYLSMPFVGDPSPVRLFKRVARERWGEWAFLLTQAPRPSNYRSVLTFLKDHPQGYRKALNLIPQRLLSLYLVAYQSYLWNQIAGRYLDRLLTADHVETVSILDQTLPIFRALTDAQRVHLEKVSIPLPQHRAAYADALLHDIVETVLAAEGFTLNDLKARILKRAYLPKGRRPLLLRPTDVAVQEAQADEVFSGRQALCFSFSLPSGAFATLVLKRLGWEGGSRARKGRR